MLIEELKRAFRDKRIAFVMHPEVGHILPILQLAKWLLGAGCKVLVLGALDHKELVEREGLEHVPLIEQAAPPGYFEKWSRARWAAARQAGTEAMPDLRSLILDSVAGGEAEALIRGLRLDLLCADALFWHFPLVARKVGVPAVVLETDAVRRSGLYGLPVDRPSSLSAGRALWSLEEGLASMGASATSPPQGRPPRQARVVAGTYGFPLTPTQHAEEPHRWSVAEFFLGPRCLAAAVDPPRCHLGLGIDLTRADDDFPWERIGDKPIVYVSIGTNAHHYQRPERLLAAVAAALSTRPEFQLVLHSGTQIGAADLPGVPESAVVAQRVPQLRLLERASLFVTHGGLGGIKEAIHFGVPMLVFPMYRDQFFNAKTVERLGIGIAGDAATASASDIGRMLEALAAGPHRQAISTLRSQIAAEDEFERGLEAMRAVMATPQLSA